MTQQRKWGEEPDVQFAGRTQGREATQRLACLERRERQEVERVERLTRRAERQNAREF